MPRDTARSSSSKKSPARGDGVIALLEAVPPSQSPYAELAPLVTEEPVSDQPIAPGANVRTLLDYQQGICHMEEGLRWLRLTETLVQRLERLRPCPWGSAPGAL